MREDQHSIVLVEDDRSMVVALERVLKTAGYKVHPFLSAEALLAQGLGLHVSCLILDLCLPGIQGLDLLERLRKEGVDQPVIVITARDKLETHAQALAAGVTAYLPKPFAGRDLLCALEGALNLASRSHTPSSSSRKN